MDIMRKFVGGGGDRMDIDEDELEYDEEGIMGAMLGMESGLDREKVLVEADFFNKFEDDFDDTKV